jgi:regulator of nucleoside diphosphate kinase
VRTKNIVLTEADCARLQWLIDSSRVQSHRDAERLDELEAELMRATIVKSCNVSRDVVTMNSRVRIKDFSTGRELTYQIVFPKDADVAESRISVLAPIGTALLGNRAGTAVKWRVPSGLRRFLILAVDYQPESAKAAA